MIRARRYRRRCGPSSSRPGSRGDHSLMQRLFTTARLLGPSATCLVQALWNDALEEMARDVQQHLLRISSRYGAARLQNACRRACFYRRTRNCFTIEWILEKGYDGLALDPFTDIRGQFLSPDVFSEELPVLDSTTGEGNITIRPQNPTAVGSPSGGQDSAQSRNARKIKPD